MSTLVQCPCGADATYEACCAMYHNRLGTAPTAEALMRSRYSAFALGKFDYIADTQKLAHDTTTSGDDIADSNDQTEWLKLDILETQDGEPEHNTGMVAFIAHFKDGPRSGQLQERSLFEKIDGTWFYVAGEHEVNTSSQLVTSAKVGRNDPCLCGSGKKYKKCCG